MLDCAGAAALLREWDQILVMSHASPDGDTLGSASGLLWGLKSLGKQVDFYCADPVPEKFSSLFEGLELGGFAPQHVMTVDVADKKLLGKETPQELKDRVELAIDHHATHVDFAQERWVEAESAATTELIYLLLQEMGVQMDSRMAACLYTGLATDTGCFRYRSVTPRTHRIAAALMELGAPAGQINQQMFECKSGPGGGRTHRHGFPAVFQRGAGGSGAGALQHLWTHRCQRKRFGRHCFPAPGNPRGGAGCHLEGERGRQSQGFCPGESSSGCLRRVQSAGRGRSSGSCRMLSGTGLFGASSENHGRGLRNVFGSVGPFVKIRQGQHKPPLLSHSVRKEYLYGSKDHRGTYPPGP